MFQLRAATDADLPSMVEVIRAAFAEYEDRLDPPSSAQRRTVESTRQELANGSAVVATVEQNLAGCVLYFPKADHMYFARLAVLPAYRGYGIGRSLIAAVEERARDAGLQWVELSVRLQLVELRAAYERLGYRALRYGTHAGYSAPTYVTLYKPLVIDPPFED
ncbi:MAG TPA: GNAT family N-acetyltransferase [Herpetosiphonaceae bacterium]